MKKFRVALLVLLAGLALSFSSCSGGGKATDIIVNECGDTMWYLTIDGKEYFQRVDDGEYIVIEVPVGNDKLCTWYTDGGTTLWDINMNVEAGVWTVHFDGSPNKGHFTVYEGDIWGFLSSGSSPEYDRSAVPAVEYQSVAK
jgi:hypothetical protein